MFSIKSFLAAAIVLLTLTTGSTTTGLAAEPAGLGVAKAARAADRKRPRDRQPPSAVGRRRARCDDLGFRPSIRGCPNG